MANSLMFNAEFNNVVPPARVYRCQDKSGIVFRVDGNQAVMITPDDNQELDVLILDYVDFDELVPVGVTINVEDL